MGHVDVKVEQTVEIEVQAVIAGRFLDTYVLPSVDQNNIRDVFGTTMANSVLPLVFKCASRG